MRCMYILGKAVLGSILLNLPQKVCITNMLSQAQALGCSSEADITCLCKAQNFRFGVRDCIAQACPPADQATVTTFGNSICAGM